MNYRTDSGLSNPNRRNRPILRSAAGRYDERVRPTNRRPAMRGGVVLIVGLLGLVPAARADDKPRYEVRKDHDPDGIGKFYLGREIAHVMGHQAAGWLERPEREKEEDPAKLIAGLDVKEGMVIADVGAGSGFHTFRLAP